MLIDHYIYVIIDSQLCFLFNHSYQLVIVNIFIWLHQSTTSHATICVLNNDLHNVCPIHCTCIKFKQSCTNNFPTLTTPIPYQIVTPLTPVTTNSSQCWLHWARRVHPLALQAATTPTEWRPPPTDSTGRQALPVASPPTVALPWTSSPNSRRSLKRRPCMRSSEWVPCMRRGGHVWEAQSECNGCWICIYLLANGWNVNAIVKFHIS